MSKPESNTLGNALHELTGGKPFVFVIMAFKKGFPLYQRMAAIVRDEVDLACIRADHVGDSGHDLLAKIHMLIDRAELVIADISEMSPNVFYEVGYAVAQGKTVLLVTRNPTRVPTDLKGREVLVYRETMEGMEAFEQRFRTHLHVRVNSRVALLRDMLEASNPRPAYIVASPRYPNPTPARIAGQAHDHRTFGDNLGVRGLVSAFGAMFGETDGIELISAQYGPEDLLKRDVNLYLIGSGKVNPTAETMLSRLQRRAKLSWSFAPYPRGARREDDWRVALYRSRGRTTTPLVGRTAKWIAGGKETLIHSEDYGIIVRGPHPIRPGRMVMIMAGAHSLGTGAACLVATRSILIQQAKDALGKHENFGERNRTIWILVKGVISEADRLLDETGVSIVEAGSWA